MGARGAAYFIFGNGAAVLVGGDAREAARGQLRAGCAVPVRDGPAFGIAWGATDVCANGLVSGLFKYFTSVGTDAAGGSANRRFDHVDSGRIDLCGGGSGADGGVVEGIGAAVGRWGIGSAFGQGTTIMKTIVSIIVLVVIAGGVVASAVPIYLMEKQSRKT